MIALTALYFPVCHRIAMAIDTYASANQFAHSTRLGEFRYSMKAGDDCSAVFGHGNRRRSDLICILASFQFDCEFTSGSTLAQESKCVF